MCTSAALIRPSGINKYIEKSIIRRGNEVGRGEMVELWKVGGGQLL